MPLDLKGLASSTAFPRILCRKTTFCSIIALMILNAFVLSWNYINFKARNHLWLEFLLPNSSLCTYKFSHSLKITLNFILHTKIKCQMVSSIMHRTIRNCIFLVFKFIFYVRNQLKIFFEIKEYKIFANDIFCLLLFFSTLFTKIVAIFLTSSCVIWISHIRTTSGSFLICGT